MVHHDWMMRIYEWICIRKNVYKVISELMNRWSTRLEVVIEGNKQVSRWINTKRGFLRGDSYSPIGYCLSEIPIGMLIQRTSG
jgi:hypothetical protein